MVGIHQLAQCTWTWLQKGKRKIWDRPDMKVNFQTQRSEVSVPKCPFLLQSKLYSLMIVEQLPFVLIWWKTSLLQCKVLKGWHFCFVQDWKQFWNTSQVWNSRKIFQNWSATFFFSWGQTRTRKILLRPGPAQGERSIWSQLSWNKTVVGDKLKPRST